MSGNFFFAPTFYEILPIWDEAFYTRFIGRIEHSKSKENYIWIMQDDLLTLIQKKTLQRY